MTCRTLNLPCFSQSGSYCAFNTPQTLVWHHSSRICPQVMFWIFHVYLNTMLTCCLYIETVSFHCNHSSSPHWPWRDPIWCDYNRKHANVCAKISLQQSSEANTRLQRFELAKWSGYCPVQSRIRFLLSRMFCCWDRDSVSLTSVCINVTQEQYAQSQRWNCRLFCVLLCFPFSQPWSKLCTWSLSVYVQKEDSFKEAEHDCACNYLMPESQDHKLIILFYQENKICYLDITGKSSCYHDNAKGCFLLLLWMFIRDQEPCQPA